MKKQTQIRKCWKCHRTLPNPKDGVLGLCPLCFETAKKRLGACSLSAMTIAAAAVQIALKDKNKK